MDFGRIMQWRRIKVDPNKLFTQSEEDLPDWRSNKKMVIRRS
jgi:hypothetical protein